MSIPQKCRVEPSCTLAVWWIGRMSGRPMSIKYLGDTHVPYVSLSPLVEPDIGFSPVRLSDDLLHQCISFEIPQSTELVQSQSNKQAVVDPPCAPRSIAVFPPQKYSEPLSHKCVQFLESLHDRPGFSMIVVPSSYNRIQDSYHIFQRFVISAAYRVSYLVLDLLYRTIRWPNRTELLQLCILSACRTQSEMHPQKVESVAGRYYAGFVPMEFQS